jgi:hypothetical protein
MTTLYSCYSAELAEHILGELRIGRSLHAICLDDGMPHRETVMRWVAHDREGFAARFEQARQIGRSSPGYVGYTPETADRFLDQLACGRTMTEVCSDPDMPDHTTINRWVAADREGFAARYRRAREIGRLRNAEVPYSAETANRILDELMSGRPLTDICSEPDMPSASSVWSWISDDREGFAARYQKAREIGWHTIGDQTLQIVDDRRNDWIVRRREDGSTQTILDPLRVARAALRLKARCWLLVRMLPRVFGAPPDHAAQQKNNSDMAEVMRLVDGKTRGLPSEDEPLDEE